MPAPLSRGLLALACAVLPVHAWPTDAPRGASSSSAPITTTPRVPLILAVTVNGEPRGDHALVLEGERRILVPMTLLREWAPGLPAPAAIVIDGVPHVALDSIAHTDIAFDEALLTLSLAFAPEAFRAQSVRYQASDRPMPTSGGQVSTILNYTLGASGPTAGQDAPRQWDAGLQPAVRWREWLFLGSVYRTWAPQAAQSTRGPVALSREDPVGLTRWTFGDFTTGVSELGGGLPLAGLSFARAFDLDPYTTRQPGATFRTTAELPSTIDVYVGNVRILREQVAPGPVELSNLTYLSGRRDVRVVVRDAFGRERDVVFPFYFADRGLAAGVTDFNYGVGVVRRDLTSPSGRYANLAVSAFHRWGLSNTLTAGYQAEATRDVANAGPSLTLRSDTLGSVSLALLASRDRERGQSGAAGSVGYSYQRGNFAAGLAYRQSSPAYAFVQGSGLQGPPRADTLASASWSSPSAGSITASFRREEPRDSMPSRTWSLAYAVPIWRDWVFEASWRRIDGPLPVRETLLTLQYVAPRNATALLSYRDDRGTHAGAFQVGTLRPEGEGLGVALAGEVASTPDGSRRTLTPEAVWQARYATIDASITQRSGGGAPEAGSYRVSMSGAIAAAGSSVGFARVIDDSFAIARIVPPVGDVRVYLNQQLMGRTSSSGEIFLPRVVSYVQNAVTIDDRDVPIDRSLERKGLDLVPWSHSATVLEFAAPPTRSVSGIMRYRSAGQSKLLEFAIVLLSRDGVVVEVPTGRGGEFYVENLGPGDYAATVEIGLRTCRFRLRVPPSEEPVLRLPDVEACANP